MLTICWSILYILYPVSEHIKVILLLKMILKRSTRPPAAVKAVAVIGSKVGAGAAMEGARRARQAKKIKPWSEIELKLDRK